MTLDRRLFRGRKCYSLMIGGVLASEKPAVVRTVLGSCIAVCLFDPITNVGGMNHFMLPGSEVPERALVAGEYQKRPAAKSTARSQPDSDVTSTSTRYGVHAMELLINECMRLGGDRRRLMAKVFGGGHVLAVKEAEDSVPRRNVRFIEEFLATEGIPILAGDLGGYETRKVYFVTDSGQTFVRRCPVDEHRDLAESVGEIEHEYWRQTLRKTGVPGDVTLY